VFDMGRLGPQLMCEDSGVSSSHSSSSCNCLVRRRAISKVSSKLSEIPISLPRMHPLNSANSVH